MIFIYYSDEDLQPLFNPGDVGIDLRSAENFVLEPGEIRVVPTGVSWDVSLSSIYATIVGRSGLNSKGLIVLTGVIDPDYTGEWKVVLFNATKYPQLIARGDRIAQALIHSVPSEDISLYQGQSKRVALRGTNGFGSTGIK